LQSNWGREYLHKGGIRKGVLMVSPNFSTTLYAECRGKTVGGETKEREKGGRTLSCFLGIVDTIFSNPQIRVVSSYTVPGKGESEKTKCYGLVAIAYPQPGIRSQKNGVDKLTGGVGFLSIPFGRGRRR